MFTEAKNKPYETQKNFNLPLLNKENQNNTTNDFKNTFNENRAKFLKTDYHFTQPSIEKKIKNIFNLKKEEISKLEEAEEINKERTKSRGMILTSQKKSKHIFLTNNRDVCLKNYLIGLIKQERSNLSQKENSNIKALELTKFHLENDNINFNNLIDKEKIEIKAKEAEILNFITSNKAQTEKLNKLKYEKKQMQDECEIFIKNIEISKKYSNFVHDILGIKQQEEIVNKIIKEEEVEAKPIENNKNSKKRNQSVQDSRNLKLNNGIENSKNTKFSLNQPSSIRGRIVNSNPSNISLDSEKDSNCNTMVKEMKHNSLINKGHQISHLPTLKSNNQDNKYVLKFDKYENKEQRKHNEMVTNTTIYSKVSPLAFKNLTQKEMQLEQKIETILESYDRTISMSNDIKSTSHKILISKFNEIQSKIRKEIERQELDAKDLECLRHANNKEKEQIENKLSKVIYDKNKLLIEFNSEKNILDKLNSNLHNDHSNYQSENPFLKILYKEMFPNDHSIKDDDQRFTKMVEELRALEKKVLEKKEFLKAHEFLKHEVLKDVKTKKNKKNSEIRRQLENEKREERNKKLNAKNNRIFLKGRNVMPHKNPKENKKNKKVNEKINESIFGILYYDSDKNN